MKKKIAVYAGTFDPITIGHLWMIETGSKMFDELIVAIGVNPNKKCLFSLDERLEMIIHSTNHLPNVTVKDFSNEFLINYAKQVDASFVLRGIRNAVDYEYEKTMRSINSDIDNKVVSVFLMPPREISETSSSMVKGLMGPNGWESIASRYVPKNVLEKLKEKYHGNINR